MHAGAGHIALFLRRPGEVSEAPILCLDTPALSQSRLSATHPSRPEFVCAGKPGSEMGKSRDKLGKLSHNTLNQERPFKVAPGTAETALFAAECHFLGTCA